MASTNTVSKSEAKLKALRGGVSTTLPAGSDVWVEGEKLTQAQLLAKLDGWLSLFAGAASAKTQATAAVAALRAAAPDERAFVAALVAAVKLQFGKTSPQLAAFGIALPKARATPTPGQKAIAVAKAKATRKLRGTLGKKQRAQLPASPTPAQLLLGSKGRPVEVPVVQPVPVVVGAPGLQAGAASGSGPAPSAGAPQGASGSAPAIAVPKV